MIFDIAVITVLFVIVIDIVFLFLFLFDKKFAKIRKFSLVIFSVILWGVTQILVYISRDLEYSLLYAKIGYVTVLLLVISFYFFTASLTNLRLKIGPIIFSVIFFVLNLFTPFLVSKAELIDGKYIVFTNTAIGQIVFLLLIFYFISVILISLHRYFYLESKKLNEKFAILFLIVSIVLSAFLIIIFNIVIPTFISGNQMMFPLIGFNSSLVFTLASVYVFSRESYFGFRFIFFKAVIGVVLVVFAFIFEMLIMLLTSSKANLGDINIFLKLLFINIIYSIVFSYGIFTLIPKYRKAFVNRGIEPDEYIMELENELIPVNTINRALFTVERHMEKYFDISDVFWITPTSDGISNKEEIDLFDKFKDIKSDPEELIVVRDTKLRDDSVLDRMGANIIMPVQTGDKLFGFFVLSTDKSRLFYEEELRILKKLMIFIVSSFIRISLYTEIEVFNQTLKHKVNEQTKELQVKIKELEEARKKEADMIDIMGHELRTPATVVKLNAELLEKFVGSNPADFKKYLDRIKDSVQTEIGLINTLLTSAKLEGDKVEIQAGKVDIKAEIDMAMHGHEVDLKEKGLEFVDRVDTNTPEVYADKVRVVEVLNNLVSNGIKYTEKGSITITTEYDDKFVKISIQDTGKGIPKENLEKLGGKFYRIDNYLGSEIVRPGGTGLGLYVTFGLVKLMGGDIWVESEVGKGSKFTFTLPVYKGQVIKSSDSSNMFEKLGLKK